MKRWHDDRNRDDGTTFAVELLDAVGPLDERRLAAADAPRSVRGREPRVARWSAPLVVRVALALVIVLGTAVAAAVVVRQLAMSRRPVEAPPRTVGTAQQVPSRRMVPRAAEGPAALAPALDSAPARVASGAAVGARESAVAPSPTFAPPTSRVGAQVVDSTSPAPAPVRVAPVDVAPVDVAPVKTVPGSPAPKEPGSPGVATMPAAGPATKLPLDDEPAVSGHGTPPEPRFDDLLDRLSSPGAADENRDGVTLLLRSIGSLRAHRPADTTELAIRYLDQNDRGLFVEDAYALAIVGAARGKDARALALAQTYQRRFPDGRYRGLAAEVVRRAGVDAAR